MRSLLVFSLICFSGFSGKLIAQDAAKEMDHVYGLDQLLYNGTEYTYFLPPGTGGHQFLISTDYITGEVTIKGKRFEGINLNYDIYNQQLLLRYTDETGAFNIIGISKAWLESFRMGDMEFRYLSLDNEPRFYQVLGKGPDYIMYYWRKDLKLDANYGARNFTFTLPVKMRYLYFGDKLWPFRNKRSLISKFDTVYRPEIKNYMQVNRIKIKKATDETMTGLIDYIGNFK